MKQDAKELALLFLIALPTLCKAQIQGQCVVGEKDEPTGKCYPAVAGKPSTMCYAKVAGHDDELKDVSAPAASTDPKQAYVAHENNTICNPDDHANLTMYDQEGNLKAGWMFVWPNPDDAFGQRLRLVTPPGTYGIITIKNLFVGGDIVLRDLNPWVTKTASCPSGSCACPEICIPSATNAPADPSKPQPNIRTLLFNGDSLLASYIKTPANSCADVGMHINKSRICPCPAEIESAHGTSEVCPAPTVDANLPYMLTKNNASQHIQILYAKAGFTLDQLKTNLAGFSGFIH